MCNVMFACRRVANTHQSKNQTNHGGVRSTASWRLGSRKAEHAH
jgi:hypothetical protein